MKHIGNITYAEGAKHKVKRIGRGVGSGHGGTSTQGHKGQKSRSGATVARYFEGGQMPINRRLPKFGFTNRFRKEYQVVNLSRLQELFDDGHFPESKVDIDLLCTIGAASKNKPLKVLGTGEIKTALTISAHSFSETAKQKIESAGGTAVIHG